MNRIIMIFFFKTAHNILNIQNNQGRKLWSKDGNRRDSITGLSSLWCPALKNSKNKNGYEEKNIISWTIQGASINKPAMKTNGKYTTALRVSLRMKKSAEIFRKIFRNEVLQVFSMYIFWGMSKTGTVRRTGETGVLT